MRWSSCLQGPVLEVGAGHRPYPQSDVLVDKYLTDEQREGALRRDGRPLIVCGLEQLPFRDQAFAYVIAAHVVEHVEDPLAALAELARVARAGYIETPSALMELIEPHRAYHLWSVLREGDTLVFLPKEPEARSRRQQVTNRLITANAGWKLFAAANPPLFKTMLDWRGSIPARIESRAYHPDEALSAVPQGPRAFAAALARRAGAIAARRLPRSMWARARPRPDLASLLCCPRCRTAVELLPAGVRCARCGGGYPRDGEILFLTPDRFEADRA